VSIDTIGRVNDVLDMEDDEIDGDEVLSTARNDDVCKLLGGDAELFKSWLHQGSILVKHVVRFLPLCWISLKTRLAKRVSASVSTKSFMSKKSLTLG